MLAKKIAYVLTKLTHKSNVLDFRYIPSCHDHLMKAYQVRVSKYQYGS